MATAFRGPIAETSTHIRPAAARRDLADLLEQLAAREIDAYPSGRGEARRLSPERPGFVLWSVAAYSSEQHANPDLPLNFRGALAIVSPCKSPPFVPG
jgi:hypothetical protein